MPENTEPDPHDADPHDPDAPLIWPWVLVVAAALTVGVVVQFL